MRRGSPGLGTGGCRVCWASPPGTFSCRGGSCSHGVWGMQRFSTRSGSSTQEYHLFPAQRTEVQIAEPSCRVNHDSSH
ncbi:hypothetical protein AV530_002031 [Patagioenas fasciata monilis]|uniref:Uncharacterized protein n=1 Tax=Patagioenas fasciata monilis TaxID=372326 RepID=A0A1V4J7M7_PATFA|nr:hypothetical protein AV530_002031 [Patagioenas fasciata monilis]